MAAPLVASALVVLAAALALAALVVGRFRRRHEVVGAQRIVTEPDGDLCVHDVCACNAVRRRGDSRWHPLLCHR